MNENFFPDEIISELENNLSVFNALLKTVSEKLQQWKPAPDKWCALEIVCHLRDEEVEDFRARLNHVFTTPSLPMPGIDPVALVTERKYMEQNYNDVLAQFIAERKKSIVWLRSLHSPDYSQAYIHPKFGPLSGNLFLTNWLAHDYLHLRQITKLKYDYLKFKTGQDLKYAGAW
jgi:hypothetical protein